MRYLTTLLLVSLAACGVVQSQDGSGDDDDGPGPDDPSFPSGRCDSSKPFGVATPLDNLNTNTGGPSRTLAISGDELTAVVSELGQLLATRRDDADAAFPQPTADLFVQINNGSLTFEEPSLTGDGLHAYFLADGLVFHAERGDADAEFTGLTQVTVDGSNVAPAGFTISSDGQTLYAVDSNDGVLRSATVAADANTFETINVEAAQTVIGSPVLSPDELRLYYANEGEIFVATRESPGDEFGLGESLGEVNSPDLETPLFISDDDCALFFRSNRPGHSGTGDMWQARRGN